MTYSFLQHYWWFLVSLLGGLLVFLLFVQGGNSMLFSLGRTEAQRALLVRSTGRKWEFTFTTLVTFGGAFFASFPLFYSTSFGGAYWLWMLILFSFVLQAVSYEFQSGPRGRTLWRSFLVLNGLVGPFLLGVAVATFFTGAPFCVDKAQLTAGGPSVAISRWVGGLGGLEALASVWNVVLGLAVLFLARVLGLLYFMNNIADEDLRCRCSVRLWGAAVPFVLLFVAFLLHVLLKDGYAVDAATGVIVMEPYKYLSNFLDMWYLLLLLAVGVALVLFGIGRTLTSKTYVRGIWPTGIGAVLAVLALLLCAGWGQTAYYPSTADLQSSLTLANSCSSLFTLRTMAWASALIPFVLAYIFYAWRAIDKHRLTMSELENETHAH
ncbi:MAG: cytochrome d ubiquinol oxidase subunit II [Bacteroidaceae bacterium]